MCGLLFSRIIMSKIIFSKPAKSIDEQIALLQSRGMVIDDISFAKKIYHSITTIEFVVIGYRLRKITIYIYSKTVRPLKRYQKYISLIGSCD